MRERGEGAFRWKRKRAEVRLYLGPPYERRAFLLTPAITTDGPAEERAALLAGLAARLRTSGRVALALPLLERLAGAEGARDVKTITAAIETIIRGEAGPLPPKVPTFGELAGEWTSNRLSERFPDHIPKRDHEDDVYRLDKHILPVIQNVPMGDGLFTLDHAQAVLSALSPKLSAATRKHVAHLVHRVVKLAVFPLRLLSSDPIPAGWMPLGGARKAMSWPYPSEDAALLACVVPPGTRARKANGAPALPAGIPLARRVLYGFLDREGMRASEAEALERTDLDLTRGVVRLDENKTDDPRAWALRPDVVRGLSRWLAIRDAAGDHDPRVFPTTRSRQADRFRRDLELAGVTRPELFERSKARQPIRIHDLRATFVTVALSLGRSETWISDRTGHKSHAMIVRYRRAARTAEELHLGDLAPLDVAIPELRGEAAPAPSGTSEGGAAPDGNGKPPEQGAAPPTPATPDTKPPVQDAAPTVPNNGAQTGPARSEGSREVASVAKKPTKQGYSEPVIPVARLVVPVVAGSIPVTHPSKITGVFNITETGVRGIGAPASGYRGAIRFFQYPGRRLSCATA